jgi:PAS domain S-box-containing protein
VKLSLRIPLLVAGAAVAAALGVALIDYRQAAQDLRRSAEDRLLTVLQARTSALSDMLAVLQRDLRAHATNPFVIEALTSLSAARGSVAGGNAALHGLYVTGNPYPAPERRRLDDAGDLSAYSLAHRRIHPQLRNLADRYGYRDLLLADLDGNVVYSVRKRDDFATNLKDGPYRDSGIAKALQAAQASLASGRESFVDFTPYQPGGGEPAGFLSAPVYGEGYRPLGVLILEMPIDRIDRLMQQAAGLGRTGETLIAGPDGMLRAASRLASASAILRQPAALDGIEEAFKGASGARESREHRPDGGTDDVLAAFAPLDFLGTRWVVVAKVDLDEVYAPVLAMGKQALINGLAMAALVALIGFVITHLTVVRPLTAVVAAVRALAGGDRAAPLGLRPRGDEIGAIAKALVLFRDSLIERDRLAAEKQREAVLVESSRRFRAVSEANPVPLVVFELKDGAVRHANPAAAALFGLAGPTAPGIGVDALFVSAADLAAVTEAGQRGGVDGRESRLQRLDGTAFPALLSGRPLDYDGSRCLVLGIIDLTEREAAQAQIARQREMIYHREKLGALGGLLAGVAHELNNPLAVVVAQATLLEEQVTDPKAVTRSGQIRAAAERCARIVKTFLAMARQRPPARAAVDLNAAIAATIELLGYNLRTAGIELRRELAPGLPAVWADPDQVSQVLTNLIVNAQQAMVDRPAPRLLTVATSADVAAGRVRLRVSDTGPGVPEPLKARIFEPFFTTKPEGTGTGIGLWVCHDIVTSHNGSIAVQDAPGGGAAFVVELPVGGDARAPRPAPERAPAASQSRRVLVIDDEPEVASTLREILEPGGAQVDIIDNGLVALQRLDSIAYDVVLSDLNMPGMGGVELYRRLRQERPRFAERLIIVTGDTLNDSLRAFLEETGVACIEKPFIPAEVRRTVADTAARAGARLETIET